jgi:hypothetical protein
MHQEQVRDTTYDTDNSVTTIVITTAAALVDDTHTALAVNHMFSIVAAHV